jgi:hypothetical protein
MPWWFDLWRALKVGVCGMDLRRSGEDDSK